MRAARTGVALALAGATLAATGAPGALCASRTLTVQGWSPRVLAFSADRLLWTEAATVRVDPRRIAGSPAGAQRFDYYRAEVFRAHLDRASRRFTGEADTPVSVRQSIAAMGPGVLSPSGDGGFVMVPESRRFAPPVIRCCDADGVETVISSDGRADAPITVAAAWSAAAVRYAQLAAGNPLVLHVAGPGGEVAQATTASTTPGLVALSADALGWVDPAAPTTFRMQVDGAPPTELALPGPALRVWGSPRVFAVAVRVGARVALLRVDEAAPPRAVRVWSGVRLPRVALGGGAVAATDGRSVLAARSGPLRVVTRPGRQVDAIGIDGRRLAWIEHATRRGARVGVIRLARIR